MKVINFLDDDRQAHWLAKIKKSDWGAGAFLHEMLSKELF